MATELTIDEAVDDVNLPELRLTLARVYQLPPSSITLELSGGSVVVRVLIAEANDISLSEIAAAVLAVDDSTLSAAVGTGVARTAPPLTFLRNVSREEERACARGYWCTAALTIEW